jgi:four helix bundle protein
MFMDKVNSFRDLDVYKTAFQIQQVVFQLSKKWPKVEDYALTDQVRRSSRSVGANIAEAWSKRKYPAHFLSKLTDADGELQETMHWINTALACGYLSEDECQRLVEVGLKIGRQLGTMINRHDSFCF